MWFAPLLGSLVLNEILYDPAGPDAGHEFVEILNTGDSESPLAGLELETNDGARPGTWHRAWLGTSGALGPHEFLLVGGDSLRTPERLRGDLQNGPDAVRLRRGDAVLDVVGYGALTD